jgi:hypothetical protein
LSDYVNEAWGRIKQEVVWDLLTEDLSGTERITLKLFLGVTPEGIPFNCEKIAQAERRQEKTIRLRLDLAFQKLDVPAGSSPRLGLG